MGIGNALVDVIAHHDGRLHRAARLVKGSMTLIEAERALALHAALGRASRCRGARPPTPCAGWPPSAAGPPTSARWRRDGLGEAFRHDLHAEGVAFPNAPARPTVPTGRCLIVVTPDAQRTMNTFLGVSSLLGPDDVGTEVVASGQVVYMEGYLYDKPEAKAAYRKAAAVAHQAGRKVSLTLSDSFCVDRHRDDFLRPRRATRSTCCSPTTTSCARSTRSTSLDEAVARVREDCELAMVTVGARGLAGGDR